MSSIMDLIGLELSELSSLEFKKNSIFDFVYTLASANNDQPVPNLATICMPVKSQMSSIMDLIGLELSELSSLEFKKISIFDFVYTLASANIDQPVANLATIYMPIKSQMSSILGQIESEHPELFALEFGKIAESDFVYTPASTNIDQSAPNLVKMYVTIRLRMSSIMDLIGPELSELSALKYMTIRSRMSFIMDVIRPELSESQYICP